MDGWKHSHIYTHGTVTVTHSHSYRGQSSLSAVTGPPQTDSYTYLPTLTRRRHTSRERDKHTTSTFPSLPQSHIHMNPPPVDGVLQTKSPQHTNSAAHRHIEASVTSSRPLRRVQLNRPRHPLHQQMRRDGLATPIAADNDNTPFIHGPMEVTPVPAVVHDNPLVSVDLAGQQREVARVVSPNVCPQGRVWCATRPHTTQASQKE
mmetsp:Transcript_6372/g.18370  ORF Transcript_6372/g.18370 Transcript_6372/m.18370 type:complete len:205 (-) Transcript_6372:614-1228(-)